MDPLLSETPPLLGFVLCFGFRACHGFSPLDVAWTFSATPSPPRRFFSFSTWAVTPVGDPGDCIGLMIPPEFQASRWSDFGILGELNKFMEQDNIGSSKHKKTKYRSIIPSKIPQSYFAYSLQPIWKNCYLSSARSSSTKTVECITSSDFSRDRSHAVVFLKDTFIQPPLTLPHTKVKQIKKWRHLWLKMANISSNDTFHCIWLCQRSFPPKWSS